MSCTDCSNNTPIAFDIQTFISSQCADCTQGSNCVSSKDICYLGPDLPCSSIDSGDTLETALQKLDTQICSIAGDYSTYNFNCLPTQCECTITTEAQFVDAITAYTCYIQTTLNTFINTTFVDFQTTNTGIINGINYPEITCASADVNDEDSISQILVKYCTKFGSIDTLLDMSLVEWDNCFTVVSPPSDLTEGLQALADQICSVKSIAESAITALPTFNNLGTCLASPGAADSLVDTISKITTLLCTTGSFNINELNWGCIAKPSVVTTDIQNTVATILDYLSYHQTQLLTFTGDFVVTQTDEEDICQGLTVALATPLNLDRFVASNALDDSPGTLIDKIEAGSNISVDDTTTPGKLIISATSDEDFTVKASVTDTTPDYLVDKVAGASTTGISITTSYDGGTEKVLFTPTIDFENLWETLQDYILTTPEAQALFCSLVAQCPTTQYSTINWSFSSAAEAVSGDNVFYVKDLTSNIFLLNTTLTAALTNNSGTIPTPTVIAGHLYEVGVVGVDGNNVTSLTVTDDTLSINLYNQIEIPIATDNKYIFTAVGGHTYDIVAEAWNNL